MYWIYSNKAYKQNPSSLWHFYYNVRQTLNKWMTWYATVIGVLKKNKAEQELMT